MIGFDFTCYEPRMGFDEHFRLSGAADEHEWRDNGNWPGHDVPNIRGREITWHVETERSVFEYYAECMANMGSPLPNRIPDFAGFWRDKVRGMLWQSHPDFLAITLAAPPGEGFVAFMSSVVGSRMSLKVSLPMSTFATREDAPAPTVDAFMTRNEPLFFTEQASFWPYRRVEAAIAAEPMSRDTKRRLFR